MLILSRKKGETVHIGDDVTVTVLESRGNRVWIGLNAPPHVRILRQEVLERDDREARDARQRALLVEVG
jgi:carbon storage regulator